MTTQVGVYKRHPVVTRWDLFLIASSAFQFRYLLFSRWINYTTMRDYTQRRNQSACKLHKQGRWQQRIGTNHKELQRVATNRKDCTRTYNDLMKWTKSLQINDEQRPFLNSLKIVVAIRRIRWPSRFTTKCQRCKNERERIGTNHNVLADYSHECKIVVLRPTNRHSVTAA